ncbi:MAG: DoxX family protein, partial [bacterium]
MSTITARTDVARRGTRINVLLWTVQSLLCALFLFAGGSKFAMPADKLAAMSAVPLNFVYFIGCAEILGALGLVLPGIFRIHRDLTPLAAIGLLIIMVGATVITATTGPIAMAAMPFVVGILATVIAVGRRDWASFLP